MMKHAVLFAVSFAALSLSACGKNDKTPDANATDASVATNVPPPASQPSPMVSPGQTFADTVAASDTFEIESSKLAATRAASDKTKRFAEQMIKAHTDSAAKLKVAAAAASPAITPAAQLTPVQQQTIDTLSTKSGAEFDRAYADAQRQGHQMTLDTLKAYSGTGDVASLKGFATELVPTVTAHLNMAKSL